MAEPTQVENRAPNPDAQRPRRGSFAELFASRSSNAASAPSSSSPPGGTHHKSMPNAMASAMAMNQQSGSRRMSITTLGLSGSPTHLQQQASSSQAAFYPLRRSSTDYQRANQADDDEDAIDDGDAVPPMGGSKNGGSPPGGIVRRLSFGAKTFGASAPSASAERSPSDHRGSISASASQLGGGGTGISPPTSAKREGFNWSESLRNRAQRSSISSGAGNPNGSFLPLNGSHNRSKSIASSNGSEPVAPAPPQVTKSPPKRPDHFQERILKGDFYMD